MTKVLIVGSGFFGMSIAFLVAEELGIEVLVQEKREHLGGNAYSYPDLETGIEIHSYGSHIFHTNHEKIWNFVRQFSEFNSYEHRVVSFANSTFYQMPINLHTLSQFFNIPLTPASAKQLLHEIALSAPSNIESFEDAAISAVGRDLYEAFYRGYTEKQWQTPPSALPSELFARLPVRLNFDSRYFSDVFQGIPLDGYGSIFSRMADHPKIKIETGVDYLKSRKTADLIIYTGPLDSYFEHKFGALGWRTLDFEFETLDVDDFQGISVVNYPELKVPFTRIHEFQHLNPEREKIAKKTVIAKEYSRFSSPADEPYYPIRSKEDREKLAKYRNLAALEKNVHFGGRLGSYQYLDMHMAIAGAFSLFSNQIQPKLRGNSK